MTDLRKRGWSMALRHRMSVSRLVRISPQRPVKMRMVSASAGCFLLASTSAGRCLLASASAGRFLLASAGAGERKPRFGFPVAVCARTWRRPPSVRGEGLLSPQSQLPPPWRVCSYDLAKRKALRVAKLCHHWV